MDIGVKVKSTKILSLVDSLNLLFGRSTELISYYEEHLSITEANLGANNIITAPILQRLGEFASYDGKYKTARKYFKRMLEVVQKESSNPIRYLFIQSRKCVNFDSSDDVATCHTHLGDLYFHFGEYNKSQQMFTKALQIREQLQESGSVNPLDIAVLV